MIQSKTDIRVRYEETDKMGIVYHAKYLIWFEVARIDLLDQIGYPYVKLEEDGHFLPVLEVEANFRKPAKFDDFITIFVELSQPSILKMKICYKVKRGEELLATGKTKHAFVSSEGRPVRPPEKLVNLIEKYSKQ